MNRILLASVAVLGLAGTAIAADGPGSNGETFLYGTNYSANVLNKYGARVRPGANGIGFSSGAAVRDTTRDTVVRPADGAPRVRQQRPSNWEIRSGR